MIAIGGLNFGVCIDRVAAPKQAKGMKREKRSAQTCRLLTSMLSLAPFLDPEQLPLKRGADIDQNLGLHPRALQAFCSIAHASLIQTEMHSSGTAHFFPPIRSLPVPLPLEGPTAVPCQLLIDHAASENVQTSNIGDASMDPSCDDFLRHRRSAREDESEERRLKPSARDKSKYIVLELYHFDHLF